ncbi:hypothetical protein ACFPIJ_28775 [Dactylosporangium cerinum]|uniref:Tyr recombinase domain-containing protein n=1 Tax=Dactylosporangium cerinum TaxID=1434730 RepID=A0ABV9W1V5_9ACTN
MRPLGPHQIRHVVAANLLDLWYGIAEVAERLGHDPAPLMRYYSPVHGGRRRQAAADIAGLITPGPRRGRRRAERSMNTTPSRGSLDDRECRSDAATRIPPPRQCELEIFKLMMYTLDSIC